MGSTCSARRRTLRRLGLAAVLSTLLLALAAVPAQGRGLRLGLIDSLFTTGETASRDLWLDRGQQAGARVVGVTATWGLIDPTAPAASSNPTSPSDPRYRWTALDDAIRSLSGRGLEIVLTVAGAPPWAEGAGRPSESQAPAGTWRPDPVAYGRFVRAVASRYSGSFPDPARPGATLPRIRNFQIWNEPNLTESLTPQWNGDKSASAQHYRALLAAGYEAVKAVNRSNRVLAPALAPYGDPPGGGRTRPVVFMRTLLCMTKKLRSARCGGGPVRFDILAHHPINAGPPRRPAQSRQDVTTPDLARLQRVTRAAARVGNLRPRGRLPLWVTEFWYATKPPNSFGVRPSLHARWLAESLYLFWRQGVEVAVWLQLRDPEPSRYAVGSGLYFRDGTAKPALRAYRFPFVAERVAGGPRAARAWGITPRSGRVQIQRRVGARWATIATFNRARRGVFTRRIQAARGDRLRARLVGSEETSLAWRIR